jgi:hypothetical protein
MLPWRAGKARLFSEVMAAEIAAEKRSSNGVGRTLYGDMAVAKEVTARLPPDKKEL